MGLNLNIKRIIFSAVKKYKRTGGDQYLTEYEIRQIAGRAGRADTIGYVSAFDSDDLGYIKNALKKSVMKKAKIRSILEIILCKIFLKVVPKKHIEPRKGGYLFKSEEKIIEKACIFPPLETIYEFSKALENHYQSENKVNLKKTLKKYFYKNYPDLRIWLKSTECILPRIYQIYTKYVTT